MTIDDRGLDRLRRALAEDSFDDLFDLGEEAGRGGMGIVYRAVERSTGRELAVKILSHEVRDHARFFIEASVLERLSHPAIVRYAQHGVTSDGRAYLAMDWLDGESVAARVRAGAVPFSEIAAIGARVAAALAHAHAQHIIHRDLKPSNVILVGGEATRATLIDFGVAKDLEATTLTRTGQLVGTPAYMAPEQAAGRPLDARTDLFALGCLLYECAVGEPPFAGGELLEVLAQVLMRSPDPAGMRRPGIPPRLEAVISALLEKEPAHRVADAAIVAAELEAIALAIAQGDDDALSSPSAPFRAHVATLSQPTVAERPRAPARPRRWSRAAIAGAAVLAATGTVAIYTVQSSRGASGASGAADAATPQGSTSLLVLPDAPKRSAPSALLAPAFRTPPPDGQLGSAIVAATPCAARRAVALLLGDGRVLTIDGAGEVETLGTLATGKSAGRALVCLDSGKLLGVALGTAFVIEGNTLSVVPTPPPGHITDGIALGRTARWIGNGAVWAWNGTGKFVRVRETCGSASRLSPDGSRVICPVDGTVDNGKTAVKGMPSGVAQWSQDGKAIYVSALGAVRRWRVGDATSEVVAGGGQVVEAGSWLVSVDHSHLEWSWIGRGRHVQDKTNLGAGGASVSLVAALPGGDQVVVAYQNQHLAVVTRGKPAPAPPTDRHRGAIREIVFAEHDALVTLGSDRQLIRHDLRADSRRLFGTMEMIGTTLIAWPGGGVASIGYSSFDVWTASGARTTLKPGTRLGLVQGTSDLVRATPNGIAAVTPAGQIGEQLLTMELPQVRSIEVDHSRRYVLAEVGGYVELIDRQLARAVARSAGESIMHAGFVAGAPVAFALVDGRRRLAVATLEGIRPVARLDRSIEAFASSPVGRRFAVASGREVIIYDADRRIELARGELATDVTAIAWSADGKRIAAAAKSTELAVWDVP